MEIIGYEPSTPTITITPRTETANIGDTILFDYSITGLEEYSSISANVVVWTNKSYSEAQIEGVQVEGGLTGTISTKIKYGYGATVELYVDDVDGRTYSNSSKRVEIIGYEPSTPAVISGPVITITPHVEEAQIGETIAFDYSITGIDQCQYISAGIMVSTDESLRSWQGVPEFYDLKGTSGSFKYEAKFGYGIKATIDITDENGQHFHGESAIVKVTTHSILYLPSNLQTIETEAFYGISAQNVYIPSSVNEIEIGAFSENITVHAEENSYAAKWARDNGYELIIVE